MDRQVPQMPDSSYIGSELEIFKHAVKWKNYYGSLIKPYLGKDVLEVGAGIGATTEVLSSNEHTRWVCLEPDGLLVEEIVKKIKNGILPPICEPRVGDISCLGENEVFDSVLYIDVLEHIEDDRAQIEKAASHIRTDGHLIILAPAHQFLYTPFDQAIGHFRRYSRRALREVVAGTGLMPVSSKYLDSAGIAASLANKLLLRSAMPTKSQIVFWDKYLVSASRLFDPISFFTVGKSILGIWKRV